MNESFEMNQKHREVMKARMIESLHDSCEVLGLDPVDPMNQDIIVRVAVESPTSLECAV